MCNVEKATIYVKTKYVFYKHITRSLFPKNTKMAKNPTTNVLIIYNIYFFYFPSITLLPLCSFCGGHKTSEQRGSSGGGGWRSRQGLTHLG